MRHGTQFYMVARQPTHAGSKTEPRARYDTLDAATVAATKLAAENACAFVVLGVVHIAHPRDLTQSTLF
jgi:hypothetical protein